MYEKLVADVKFLEGDLKTAAEMYLEGARDGDAVAAFNYGYCLWRGLGVPYDPKDAKSYFSFARDAGDGEASYNLAMLYLHGEGVPRDYKKAYEYMCNSADDGCVEAILYLGMVYTTGGMFEPEVVGISMIPYHKPEYLSEIPMLEGDIPDLEADEEARYSVTRPDPSRAFECFMSRLIVKTLIIFYRLFADTDDNIGVENVVDTDMGKCKHIADTGGHHLFAFPRQTEDHVAVEFGQVGGS